MTIKNYIAIRPDVPRGSTRIVFHRYGVQGMHCIVLLCVDLLLISISTLTAVALSWAELPLPALAAAEAYVALTLTASLPILLLYRLNRTLWRFTSLGDIVRIAVATSLIVVLVTSLAGLSERIAIIPPRLPLLQGLLLFYGLGGARIAMRIRHDLRRRTRQARNGLARNRENVLVIGLTPLTDLFLYCVTKYGHGLIDIVGILSGEERHRGRLLRSRKILGTPQALDEALHDLSVHGVFVDRIVVAAPKNELTNETRSALSRLEHEGKIRIEHLPGRYGLSDCVTSGESPSLSSPDPANPPINPYLRWKRMIDFTVALAFTIIFAPAMVVVFVAVLLDVGWPVIFWQQRPGARGRPIKVLKFRTMGAARDRAGHPLSDAERVSKIGHTLRRLRLDELPQVFNVLIGQMSLVGPRPLLPVDQPAAPEARLRLRPGLTGWAQIKGGRHLSSEDKAALDLWYIGNASFALDMTILAHTVHMVLFGERIDQNAVRQAWQALRPEDAGLLTIEPPEQSPI